MFQGDLWWRPRWHVYFFVSDLSSFHPNGFRNATSWKCFLKGDCIRSSLIEIQSFPNCKIDVDPIYCVLMSFPCFIHVLCTTRYTQVHHIRILVIFVHRINRQKEYCLSFAQTLDLQVFNPELMIECKLNAHPGWKMYWKKLLWIITLSCNEGSIRLRPECPWRARK